MVAGGSLVIANIGDTEAKVELAGDKGKPRTVTVPAGAAVVADGGSAVLTSSAPVSAGVRYVSGGDIASYPVQTGDAREGELIVYTR
ncbi:hypothetical protein [Leucobacter insecticola]|uniref:hypothetical protein n=1 Tax=Leucobacter insecticola TaxID=2714934 RepID=UPI001FCB6F93|nr:hypothetical protein [Leucobacter insecticola]